MAEKKKVDYNPVTAQVVMASTYAEAVTDDKELADEAGVVNPAHVDYNEALKNYESRDDVESLANRRAREAGTSFSDADFVRTNDPSGVVTATDASKDDVKAAEKSKSEQAKATEKGAEKDNKSTKVETDNDDKNDKK